MDTQVTTTEPPPAEWGEVSSISSGDTNSSIFSKLTSMVRNVRWLYNKLGTVDISGIGDGTVSSGLNTVQSELDGKAENAHTHGVGDLPVSNSQVNSTSYVPSSSVTYSLNTLINELGTEIDEIVDQAASMVIDTLNTTYESKSLGTWSSASDVDTFLSRFNHNSFYSDGDTTLALGNYVTIQDGTYNAIWEIAGFDMEHNQTAADGTVYDNGCGICMIPKTKVADMYWNASNTTEGGYKSSNMHTSSLPSITTTLKNVLGNHIVNRNVLLSSTINNGNASAYTWTTAEATLMSIGQMTGTFASHRTKYDDGEANYKLPLFNYEEFKAVTFFWSRCINGPRSVWVTGSAVNIGDGIGGSEKATDRFGVRPLIYIR